MTWRWANLFRSARKRARGLRRAGDQARNAKAWPEAIAAYRCYLAAMPQDWRIMVQLGNAYKEAGDYIAAEIAYKHADSLAPDDADVKLQLGHVLKLAGRMDEAREAYAASAALQPGGDAARELASLGGPAVFASGPLAGPTAPNLAKLSRDQQMRALLDGHAARDQRQWPEAARLYRLYLSAQPKAADIWRDLSTALQHAGNDHEAYDAIRQAVALKPDSVALLRQQALLLRAMGRVEAAQAIFMLVMQRSGSSEIVDDAGRPVVID